MHKQLFQKQHPLRQIVTHPLLKNTSRQLQSQTSKISFITSFMLPHGKYALVFVLQSGNITYLEAAIDRDLKIDALASYDSIPISTNSAFASSNKGSVLYTQEEKKVLVLKKGKVEATFPLFSETNILAYPKHAFLFCPDFCTVSYINELEVNPKPHSLRHSSCRIALLKASSRFKIFAYGTIDGYVSVHNLRNGNLVNKIYVGGEPEHLLITRNWGFVVAATLTTISVLSVNGELIRQATIDVPITRMFEFELRGVDYITYERSDHRLAFFEAFKPTERMIFFESREPVHVINYNAQSESFFLVTDECIKAISHKII